ncbi:MAG: GNAT family N-acetyltransferase [Candidatus Thorarchaeota archaeon]
MSTSCRELDINDYPHVKSLCALVWEDDYVPDQFPLWVEDSNWIPVGVFDGDTLSAIAALQLIPGTTLVRVNALRVIPEKQRKGYGTKLTSYLVQMAQESGAERIWYGTSTRNEASISVAKKLGFKIANMVGYFRVYRPYPPHPAPSPNIHPLEVDADRLYGILSITPELIESSTIPNAWMFETTDLDGLRRIGENTTFHVYLDDTGKVQGLHYTVTRERKGVKSLTNSIFVTDRTIFVDIVSRAVDFADKNEYDRAVFFLGPRATEWSKTLGFVPEEFEDRAFILLELNPQS